MKLKRDQFDVLFNNPPGSGGGGGEGQAPKGVLPLNPTGGEGKSDDDKNGQNGQSSPGEPEDGSSSSGSGSGGGEKPSVKIVPGGGIGATLTQEESKALQESLGMPVELPTEADGAKMVEDARRHSDKLSQGGQGSGKGSLARAIGRLAQPIVDWKSALKRFIGKAMSSSELYLGSRRHLYKGDYFYGEKHKFDALSDAIVAVDTSGSMTKEAITMILSETAGIIKAKKVKKTTVVYFDDGIQNIDVVGEKPRFDFSKASGGGGTSFLEPLQYMEQEFKKGKMSLAVFMTDGHANLNLPIPKWKNIFVWVILDNPTFKAPFGNLVVHISKKQMEGK